MPEKTKAQLQKEVEALRQRLAETASQLVRSQDHARRLQAERAHAARLTDVGEMALSLVHEVQQPLTAILTYAEVCSRLARQDESEKGELLSALERITAQAGHAAALLKRLRRFVAPGEAQHSPVQINDAVREAVTLVEALLRREEVQLEIKLAEGLPAVEADQVQLEQVLVNLLRNATEALVQVPPRERSLSVTTSREGDEVQVAVSDRGPGLTVEIVQRLFEPFQTTKAQGLGVGLALSRSIVQAHGGRMWVKPNPDAGTTFFFALPVAPGARTHGNRSIRRGN